MPASLKTGRFVGHPSTRAIVPTGEVFIANGMDAPQRHDGITASTENAGIPGVTIGSFAGVGDGAGSTLSGVYLAAVRYLDDEGIPGDLSATITFTLSGTDSEIDYTAVPVSSDSRVTQRQVFRNTPGQTDVFYLDGTISDNTTTTLTTTNTDAQLQASTVLQILAPDRSVNARRYGVPPNHMQVVVHHQDRTFWSVPVDYSEGHASVGGTSVVGIVGGVVTEQMVGRVLTLESAVTSGIIQSVSLVNNTVTTDVTVGDITLDRYTIAPAKAERNKTYYSFAGEPEAVYSEDAVITQDEQDGETSTGVFLFNSFYFITSATAIRRWTFTTNPGAGAIYPNASRGMLNQRCQCRVENWVYLLDRAGIYRFNGSVNEIDQEIQDYFRDNLVWENSKWWHAAAFTEEQSVKFFVTLDGSYYPRHALVFNYRTGRWWEEEYHREIGDSALVPAPISRRLLLGSQHGDVMVQSAEVDGPSKALTGRYTVTSATDYNVTLSGADWNDADLVGAPIAVTEGRGKKQRRTILEASAATGKVEIDRPWMIEPDSTSIVQIGGIHYQLATKHFTNDREDNDRGIEVVVDPYGAAATMDMRVYINRKKTATTSNMTESNQENVEFTKGDENFEINIKEARTQANWDGVTQINLQNTTPSRGAGDRFIQFELDGDTNGKPVVFREMTVKGVE